VDDYAVYLRAPDLSREALIEDYQKLECIERHIAVGAWSLQVDVRTAAAAKLATPGYGIEVVLDGGLVLAGPMTTCKRDRDSSQNTLTVGGPDDMVWLSRRVAHPQPATPVPPYNANEHDVRTDLASTVLGEYVDANAGPGALPERRIPTLTIAPDPLLGATITGRARWQNLLVLLQELALAGGVAFRVQQVDEELEFSVRAPEDLTADVQFSEPLGNLEGYKYDSASSPLNFVYLGGQGEGTARVIVEGQAPGEIIDWGRIESFQDRRDTADTDELTQHIVKVLAENTSSAGLVITPADTDRQVYRVDYRLGDRVTAVIDGIPVQDQVQEVQTVITPAEAAIVRPTIGSQSRRGALRLFDLLRAANARLIDLERR